jgi:hypothetical protein
MKTFTQACEVLGPVAVKTLALIAGIAVFVPLLAAFAAPFVG